MRVTVDMNRCESSGMCTSIAPEIFELGDDGALVVLEPNPTADLAEQLRAAVDCCPVEAISVAE